MYCSHPVLPGLGEVAHRISPLLRPDLGWEKSNLAPAHGAGRRRCPDCYLACNFVAAISPIVPRSENGETLSWSPELIVRLQASLKRKPPPAPPAGHESAGREWLAGEQRRQM
jgi:hypothetical protein